VLILDELWTDETFPDARRRRGRGHRTAGILAVGTLARVVKHGDGDPMNQNPWRAEATFGLVFADVVRLVEPVRATGMLGFWTVPADAAEAVRAAGRRVDLGGDGSAAAGEGHAAHRPRSGLAPVRELTARFRIARAG
jgi:hypothetical protein